MARLTEKVETLTKANRANEEKVAELTLQLQQKEEVLRSTLPCNAFGDRDSILLTTLIAM